MKLKKALINASWFASPVTFVAVAMTFHYGAKLFKPKTEIELAYDLAAKRIVEAIENIELDFSAVSDMLDDEVAFLKTIDPNYK